LRGADPAHLTGIFGWPLSFTLSPAIHNAAFHELGMDWVYMPFPVAPDALADAVGGARSLGMLGVNVTMPHKESVIPHLDQISGDSRAVGAVNTIQRVGDKLIGHNTDVDGFREFLLSDVGVDVGGKSALVLGSGGAARAVVRALDVLGAREIAVAARTEERGSKVAELAGRGSSRWIAWAEAGATSGDAEVVVNATPIGAGSSMGDGGDVSPDPLPEASWHPGQIVVDLVYDPPATALVERARAGGAEAWGGIGMLVHQAAASFQIWTGQDPPLETMSAAALRSLRARPHR